MEYGIGRAMSKRSHRRRRKESKKRRFKNGPRRTAGRVLDALDKFDPSRVAGSIQEAIDALPESGGTVFVDGLHVIGKPISINKRNVSVVGRRGTIKLLPGVEAAFSLDNTGLMISGVCVEGGALRTRSSLRS